MCEDRRRKGKWIASTDSTAMVDLVVLPPRALPLFVFSFLSNVGLEPGYAYSSSRSTSRCKRKGNIFSYCSDRTSSLKWLVKP